MHDATYRCHGRKTNRHVTLTAIVNASYWSRSLRRPNSTVAVVVVWTLWGQQKLFIYLLWMARNSLKLIFNCFTISKKAKRTIQYNTIFVYCGSTERKLNKKQIIPHTIQTQDVIMRWIRGVPISKAVRTLSAKRTRRKLGTHWQRIVFSVASAHNLLNNYCVS